MTVTSLHERAKKQASEADRLWFERHPDRIYRMRDTARWEVPHLLVDKAAPGGTSWRMIVAQVPDMGIRFKVQVCVTDNVPSEEMDDETLRQVFQNFAPPFLVDKHEEMLAMICGLEGSRHDREPKTEVMVVLRRSPEG